MNSYDKYVFVLCLIVFIALTVFLTILIVNIAKLSLRMIRSGIDDENILAEYEKRKLKPEKNSRAGKIFTAFFFVLFFCISLSSLYMKVVETKRTGEFPVLRAVYSGSMSEKNEKNKYLFSNELNDQFDRFDLILTHKLPDEFNLRLYDVVVYQSKNGDLIIHRIVGIEEPNEKHPESRLFTFQGDAIASKDKYAVTYDQMRGIYRGKRIPFIGSFVLFLQSPAGTPCVILILFGIIAIPLLDKKIEEEQKKRLPFEDR